MMKMNPEQIKRHEKLYLQIKKQISNYLPSNLLNEQEEYCWEGSMALQTVTDTMITQFGCTEFGGPTSWFNGEATWTEICSGGEFTDSNGDWWDLNYFMDLFQELPDESNICACTLESNNEDCVEDVYGCTDENYLEYSASANVDDGSCIPIVEGCTDPEAFNYDETANTDDGSCIEIVYGCTNPESFNYNSEANTDDDSCIDVIEGCIDPEAFNYDETANTDDGSCVEAVPGCTDENYLEYNPDVNIPVDDWCVTLIIEGCTDPEAFNYFYTSDANVDDGSCCYDPGCTDPNATNYDSEACFGLPMINELCEYPIEGCMDQLAWDYNPEAEIEGECNTYTEVACNWEMFEELISVDSCQQAYDLIYPLGGWGNPYPDFSAEPVNNILNLCCNYFGIEIQPDCNQVLALGDYEYYKFCTKCEMGGYATAGPMGPYASLDASQCSCCEGGQSEGYSCPEDSINNLSYPVCDSTSNQFMSTGIEIMPEDLWVDVCCVHEYSFDPFFDDENKALVGWGCIENNYENPGKFCLPLSPNTILPQEIFGNQSMNDLQLYPTQQECANSTPCYTGIYTGTGDWMSSLPWPTISEEKINQLKKSNILREILQIRANIKK